MSDDTMAWATVGAKVAIFVQGRNGHAERVTIERMTPTQILVPGYRDDDAPRRFWRSTLRLVGNHYGPELLPLTDERVRAALRTQQAQHSKTLIETILKDLGGAGGPDPVEIFQAVATSALAAVARLKDMP